MINFKLGLDMWGLGDRFVVLCLDRECVQAAESHEIHAYTRYLMTAGEAGDDWHLPVARIKVMLLPIPINSSSPPISTSSTVDTISFCSTETYT